MKLSHWLGLPFLIHYTFPVRLLIALRYMLSLIDGNGGETTKLKGIFGLITNTLCVL